MSKEEKKEVKKEEKKEEPEITINDLPGVGAATAEKLREAGYDNLISLAVASPGELVQASGLGEASARKLINFCRNHLDMGFETGDQLLKKREQIEKITTGSKMFDDVIGGGFETGSISETFGQFGSGKCVAKDTNVFYFNPDKPHLRNIKETYEKYKSKFGEKPHEEGFVVPLSGVSVLGLTKKGLRKTKAKFLYKEYAKKIYEIETRRGRIMRFTGAHKLLTFDKGLQWKATGLFKKGEILACPNKIDCEGKKTISNDDAYFLGLFAAEGTSNPLSITTGSKVLKDWLAKYIKARFGYEPTTKKRKGKTTTIYLILFRKPTKEFLRELAVANSSTKFVPERVLSGDENIARNFLAGYLDGDGCIREDEISATTKSKKLATGVSYVFRKLGILTTLRNQKGFSRINVVGEDRAYLKIPLKIKKINNKMRNSKYGYTGNILNYLAETYSMTLGGNRGRQEKNLGRKKNHNDIFYHYLTNKSQRKKAMNEKTFIEIIKKFEIGKTYIDEALSLLPEISDVKTFRKMYVILPFAFNSLHKELGLTKSALQNYKKRGIPKHRIKKVKEVIARELIQREKLLEEARENMKRIAYFEWDVIENVKEKEYNDYVYDFVVPEGHSFVAGDMPTVMHNSQVAHVIAVTTQLPKEKGGANGSVIFIDGESTFRPERIQQIAKGYGLDPDKTLKNIHIARAFNSDHQMLLAEKSEDLIRKLGNVKLIIVDSLTSHFRADFHGRGQLADRQQKLNKHMHVLMKLATKYNICIYVTNQVMAKPDTFFGDPTAAIGGNIVGHNSATRVYLRKGKKGSRVAKLIDSPHLPDGEAAFMVTEEGLKDLD